MQVPRLFEYGVVHPCSLTSFLSDRAKFFFQELDLTINVVDDKGMFFSSSSINQIDKSVVCINDVERYLRKLLKWGKRNGMREFF